MVTIGNTTHYHTTERQETWLRAIALLAIGAVFGAVANHYVPGLLVRQHAVNGTASQEANNQQDHVAGGADRPQVRGDLLQDLNRSRLAGSWVKHNDGSYEWANHPVILKVPVPGGELVNASDARWEFREPLSAKDPTDLRLGIRVTDHP